LLLLRKLSLSVYRYAILRIMRRTQLSRYFMLPATLLLAMQAQAFRLDAAQSKSTPATLNASANNASANLDRSIRAEMSFLASDILEGRGSATHDETVAALFAAEQFAAMGLEPGGDNGGYLQSVPMPDPLPKGVQFALKNFAASPRTVTTNVIAILRGSDPALREQVILLTAHIDHLGMAAQKTGDFIYNGANDDASGSIAVLELARSLSMGKAPRRTIVFALFGSEELGGFGNRGFLAHPPVPLKNIVANLEFEMIGWADSAVPEGTLWLTGYDRSNLGPELAKHGAALVADPHPSEHFFQRSDNYALARSGIIAHTVSSFGLQPQYHRPDDDIAHIDFAHMTHAILSMESPVRWLADTDWKPSWNPGGKP
jgi:hypothetical protein